MSENNEKLNPAPDTGDEALESFLSRNQDGGQTENNEQQPAKKRPNKLIITVIIAVLAVAALVITLLAIRSQPIKSVDEDSLLPAEFTTDVDENGVHQAKVDLDENGNIKHNGNGSLLSYVPSDLKQIDVENTDGSFTVLAETPEGEATVYTIVGFEDYDTDTDAGDRVANDAAALDFLQVISADGKLSDFGLDNPRATVDVSFNDDTKAKIRIGNDAAAEAGVYVAFGSSDAVYLVASDSVDSFFLSVTEFISLDITPKLEDSDTSDFTTLTISGSRYDAPITLVPNTDEALNASYYVTDPISTPANAVESYDIAGSVRGLTADSAVCVNPSDDQLEKYGLSKPYATVSAVYPDCEIELRASQSYDDGSVYVFNPDKNVIYTIQIAKLSWAKTSVEALMPEQIVQIKIESVDGIEFSSGENSYSFDVSSQTSTETDEGGNEQTVTTVSATCGSKKLTEDNFRVFFQNLNGIKNQGPAEEKGDKEVMSFTISYSTGRNDDTVVVRSSGDSAKYIVELNGATVGTASKSYIDRLIESAATLAKGGNVTNLA